MKFIGPQWQTQANMGGGSSSDFGKLIIPETSFDPNNKIITTNYNSYVGGYDFPSIMSNIKYPIHIYDNCYWYNYDVTQFYININAIGKNAGNDVYEDYSKVKFIIEDTTFNGTHGIETYSKYFTSNTYSTKYLGFRILTVSLTSAPNVSRLYKLQIYIKEDN